MPTQKLTKRLLDAAEVQPKAYELRDTEVPGFLCKVTPAGSKIFMLQYRTLAGQRRKPAIGSFGALTVEQARAIAQEWSARVRAGKDPSQAKDYARNNPTMRQFCDEFISRHSIPNNKPLTTYGYKALFRKHIIPRIGAIKVDEVTRVDIANLVRDMARVPISANKALDILRFMFKCAEVWGYRTDGTNPCKMIPRYPAGKRTRLLSNAEMRKVFDYLDRADTLGLEHPIYTLGIRLQFAFAARMSEITNLEWSWIDFEERRVTWPDSKTGPISKPISAEAYRLLKSAPRFEGSPFVIPGTTNYMKALKPGLYWQAWKRVLTACEIPHVGTHAIRHRTATDIANSGVPLKVGMALTAHKAVKVFMSYVHAEDEQVRAAAELVSERKSAMLAGPPVENIELKPAGKIRGLSPRKLGETRKIAATQWSAVNDR
ncbi:tyrosine-type recombinase/integrase [Novosphingobium kaempferiae]|uniref:tyrosine-type recombinase/integrase n=1 Tax=Novosphingobium kaempferiae TaxID=2896849 RepID=UPI001E470D2A|nr:site-specific integrase [Novosphingobium kaempferiae]